MASILKVDKLDPQSGTDLEIGSSGDTITIPSGATFTQSGTMNASAITAGTIATARLGSGTASSSTVLYGDQTYKAEPGGGKILQVVSSTFATDTSTTSSSLVATGHIATLPSLASTSSKILIFQSIPNAYITASNYHMEIGYYSSINSGAYAQIGSTLFGFIRRYESSTTGAGSNNYLYSPSTTDSVSIQVYFNRTYTGTTYYSNGALHTANLTLMEIGA